MRYPHAPRDAIIERIHGHAIADPYRWLEDASAAATIAWCEAQDALCHTHLDALGGREALRARLRELMPGMVGLPDVRGDRAFYTRRLPDEEQPVYCVREADGTERVLVDPNAMSADRTITLDGWSPSWDGARLAYLLSDGGDEESVLRVLDVATGADIDGPIDRCRYTNVAWEGEAFYYVRKLPPSACPPGEEQLHRRVYRHRIGTSPDEDELVFGDGSAKTTYFGVGTSIDGDWLVVTASLGTAPRNDAWIRGRDGFVIVQRDEDAIADASVRWDGRLYVHTNRGAPKWRLAVADPRRPRHWSDLIPEADAVLEQYAVTRDAVVAVWTRDVVNEVTIHDRVTGAQRATVPLPGAGTARVVTRPDGGHDVWILYTDHVTPMHVLRYSVPDGSIQTWARAAGGVEPLGITARREFYASKDGTRVPIFVIRREDALRDGRRPTILHGYGGFNVQMAPQYGPQVHAWVERGGVCAIACLRGGSEYGEEWHRAGMREHKQNVFDDFIAAGEWLIAQGLTSPERLGIAGGSNGGLLMGAALTQRPDLWRAVVCSAPLLDMVRYERFGIGETWNDEYGTASDPTELEWLLSYSPYHHVRPDTAYPAVLFTTFESDTRVDPVHARKMCAALQHATSSDNPILLRRETNVGHGVRAVQRTIDLGVDTLSFFASELG
jgi:prolyl oligopeptidase